MRFFAMGIASEDGTKMPLFVLDDSVFKTISWEDALCTSQGLEDAGLLCLPWPCVDIKMRLGALTGFEDEANSSINVVATILQQSPHDFGVMLSEIDGDHFSDNHWPTESQITVAINAFRYLVTSLATKSIEKYEFARPAGRVLKNGQPKHTHVTTLRVPKVRYLPTDPAGPLSGREVRAHFRRGHIRHQPYGPGRSERKQVWIEPMFVKADADYVGQQKTYRVVA